MRFAIEHLPRTAATYQVTPVDANVARSWLSGGGALTSLIRTTELAGAIASGLGITLEQADTPVALQPGDTALLISLSYSVLLASAQGGIVPMEDDWRCLLLQVGSSPAELPLAARASLEPAEVMPDADLAK